MKDRGKHKILNIEFGSIFSKQKPIARITKKKTDKKLDENMIGDLAVKQTKAVLRSGGRE